MWLTESSWELILLCLVGTAFFIALFSKTPLKKYAYAAIGCVVLGVAIFFIERAIVTDLERVENSVYGLADACKSGNIEQTIDYVNPNEVEIRGMIRKGMNLVDIKDDLGVTDLQVKMGAGGKSVTSHFRANGTVALSPGGNQLSMDFAQHISTRWILTWSKIGDSWKITNLQRLNPITGETINPLAQASN